MTEKSVGLELIEEFVDASLLYDWLRSEGRIATLTFLLNYTDEEIEDFIRFIIKRYERFRKRKEENDGNLGARD